MIRKNYAVKDLVENSGFRRMVKGIADPHEIDEWNKWIEKNDQNRKNARIAVAEIMGFEFNDPVFPDVEQKWNELQEKTAGTKKVKFHPPRNSEYKLRWIFRAVAVLFLATITGFGVYHLYEDTETLTHLEQLSEEKTIITSGDEQKTLKFSNGSTVVIRNNSTFTYSIGLLHDQTIDVTLEGEAWFDVVSDPSEKQPVFAVTTPDGIIRDIGTKFLVTVQKEHSRVVLQEGLVEVGYLNNDYSQTEEVRFSVGKGEMVEFTHTDIVKREAVNSSFYTSWATGYIQFDQTKLQEFAEYVEHRFDVNVRIVDASLKDIRLDGAAYFRSLEGLVRSVSEVTAIPVYQSDDKSIVYIGNPNH